MVRKQNNIRVSLFVYLCLIRIRHPLMNLPLMLNTLLKLYFYSYLRYRVIEICILKRDDLILEEQSNYTDINLQKCLKCLYYAKITNFKVRIKKIYYSKYT